MAHGPVRLVLTGDSNGSSAIVYKRIEPALVGMLTQVRRTVDDTEVIALAESFLESGQLHPGMVAALPLSEAQQYVDDINSIWGTTHELNDLCPVGIEGESYFLILVAGHMRWFACERLNQRNEQSAHYDGRYFAEIRFGLSAEKAIDLQFQENIHVNPPPAEEAQGAARYYRWRKQKNQKLTLAAFARVIGKTEQWVRNALRFASLPDRIQSFAHGVEYGGGVVKIHYGMLVELARLVDRWKALRGEPMPESEIEYWLFVRGIASRKTVTEFRASIDAFLRHEAAERESGQIALFDVAQLPNGTRSMRQVALPHLLKAVVGNTDYLRRVLALYRQGAFDPEDHPLVPEEKNTSRELAAGSPLRQMLVMANLLIAAGQDMKSLALRNGSGKRQVETTRALLPEVRDTIELFEENPSGTS